MKLNFIKKLLGNVTKGELLYAFVRILCFYRQLDPHKYLFISMRGSNYGCNPKYLALYIQRKDPNAKIMWAFNNLAYEKYKNEVECALKEGSLKYYIALYTSKYFIANERTGRNELSPKRVGQIYLQTWHGAIGPKMVEADVKWPNDNYMKGAIRDSGLIDAIISGTHFQTRLFKTSFWYDGMIFETGTPRNDIFFRNDDKIREKVYKTLNIDTSKKIVLYAPTFRATTDSFECYDINEEQIISLLEHKFGGDFVLVVRLHSGLLNTDNVNKMNALFPNAINASWYGDMQELLYSSEILITDYSSSMFDFIFTKRPCFLYAKDVDHFEKGLYIPLEQLPFPLVKKLDEWKQIINDFDEETYKHNVEMFIQSVMGSVEDGHACERCYELLKSL